MKTVFTNSQCAHVWAQLSQPYGSSDHMHFDGGVAYSYQTPVAHILRGDNGARVALFISRTYSMTTSSNHMPAYRDAVRGTATSFTVPDLLIGRSYVADFSDPAQHEVNLAYFASQYASALDKMMRCPADSYRLRDLPVDSQAAGWPTYAHRDLSERADEVENYCRAFSIPAPTYPWRTDADKAIARRERLLNDPKRAAKQEAGRLQREAAQERKRLAQIEARRVEALGAAERVIAWLAGGSVYLRYGDVPPGAGDLLRVHGDNVQTSRGATVPAPEGLALLGMWRRWVDEGTTYTASRNPPFNVGQFTLSSIDAAGDMRVGCHTFKRAELERFEALVRS